MLTKAFIPYKGYYSSPFSRWQGSMANENSIVLGANTARRWLTEKDWDPNMFSYVILGITNPLESSKEVEEIMRKGWEERVGGKIEFVIEEEEMLKRILEHIDKKRAALGLPEYDPERFGQSGDKRMNELLELKPKERAAALYGQPASD